MSTYQISGKIDFAAEKATSVMMFPNWLKCNNLRQKISKGFSNMLAYFASSPQPVQTMSCANFVVAAQSRIKITPI